MKKPSADDQFQSWLAHMDDALAEFIAQLPADLQAQLSGSLASLDPLERWLLARYPSIAAALAPAEAAIVGGAARYVGEVIREATDSRWTIDRSDPKYAFYGVPILHGGKLGSMPECPRSLVTASLDRRTGRYLSAVATTLSGAA